MLEIIICVLVAFQRLWIRVETVHGSKPPVVPDSWLYAAVAAVAAGALVAKLYLWAKRDDNGEAGGRTE